MLDNDQRNKKEKAIYKGAIERCDGSGVYGWCIRLDAMPAEINLTLQIGDKIVTTFNTHLARNDIKHPLEASDRIIAGFSLTWSSLHADEISYIKNYLTENSSIELYDIIIIKADEYKLENTWAKNNNKFIKTASLATSLSLEKFDASDFERDIRAGNYEKWRSHSVYIDHLKFIELIVGGRDIDIELLDRIGVRGHGTWVACELLRLSTLRVRRLSELTPTDIDELVNAGIQIDSIKNIVEFFGPRSEIEDVNNDTDITDKILREHKIIHENNFVKWQDNVIQERGFNIYDIYTNQKAKLIDSVKIYDRQTFSFFRKSLFMIIAGGNMNAAVCLYLINNNICVLFDRNEFRNSQNYYTSTAHMADLMAVYLKRIHRLHDNFISSTKSTSINYEQKLVLIHGRAENPAHHSWNYLSAFERLADKKILNNADIIIRPPTEYYGPIENLYPEISKKEIISVPESSAIDPYPFSECHICIQIGSNNITKNLKYRIHKWALDNVSDDFLKETVSILTYNRPIIWIGIRVGDKSWVEQIDGIVELVEIVKRKYQKAVFLLDGFSRVKRDDAIPAKWAPAFQELTEVARNISAQCKYNDTIYSLIGNTIAESVVWAGLVDAYITPIGSSQHKVGWHSQCPGIVYASIKFVHNKTILLPGGWEAEDSYVPKYLIADIYDNGRRRNEHDFRINLENLSISPNIIADELIDLISNIFK